MDLLNNSLLFIQRAVTFPGAIITVAGVLRFVTGRNNGDDIEKKAGIFVTATGLILTIAINLFSVFSREILGGNSGEKVPASSENKQLPIDNSMIIKILVGILIVIALGLFVTLLVLELKERKTEKSVSNVIEKQDDGLLVLSWNEISNQEIKDKIKGIYNEIEDFRLIIGYNILSDSLGNYDARQIETVFLPELDNILKSYSKIERYSSDDYFDEANFLKKLDYFEEAIKKFKHNALDNDKLNLEVGVQVLQTSIPNQDLTLKICKQGKSEQEL